MTVSLFQRFKGIVGGKQNRVPDLLTRFKAFQAMLDGNNRTLEAMTEMGEKLGGDYLFDVNYIRSAYARLLAAISDSLNNFTQLTDNHYPQLVEILARIDGQVQRMLTGDGPVSNRQVVFYPEITWDLAAEVGGKNYHLAELANTLHLRIPEAFAITTAAFTAFLRHNSLEERLAGLGRADSAALAQLRDAILAGGFPEDLTASLYTALETMRSRLGRNGTLAVRSSAEEEDGDFSFAGQFETVLNVPCTLEAVQAAYKEVVASLFQAGATSYQRQLGYDLGKLKMAVGCVAMVEAKVSGVIYTAAAGKDRSKMAISAAWGLGKGVVDGLTDADLYTVTKGDKLRLVERHIGGKAQMVVNCGAIGIETRETPAELRDLACLSEAKVLELARQALTIEEHFKTPQDIEWAMDKAGRYYLLQARALRMDDPAAEGALRNQEPAPTDYPVLLRNQGVVVQRGAAAGKVFILHHIDELEKIPQGSVLVASHDSPHFVQAIPFLHAIITDVGVPTSQAAPLDLGIGNQGLHRFLVHEADEIMHGPAFLLGKLLLKGIDQIERCDMAHDVFLSPELVEFPEFGPGLPLFLEQTLDNPGVNDKIAALPGLQGDLLSVRQQGGGLAGVDHGGEVELPADGGHVAGGHAHIGDDGV